MSKIDRSELQQAAAVERDAATQTQRKAVFEVMAYQVGPRAAQAILERAAAVQASATPPQAPPSGAAAPAAAPGG